MLRAIFSEKSLQTLAIITHLILITFERAITFILFIYFIIYGSFMRLVCLAYLLFWFWDWKTPYSGGRRWRLWKWYAKYLREYFPIKLVQKSELPPDKNYLLVLHPHGVLFLAFHIAFGLDAFDLKSKGLRTIITTLNFNFIFPFSREYFLSTGAVSASESSIKSCLLDPDGGNLTVLLPGGAAEASHANPGVYKIILKNRKGFCRIAMQTGAPLVPTFVFGEVDAYYVTSRDDNILVKALRYISGINFVAFGNKPGGQSPMPRRVPITIVMGEPIPVEKNESPSKNDIEELHSKYVDAISSLYDSEKLKYLDAPYPELTIV